MVFSNFNKYGEGVDSDSSEHYYQNQNMGKKKRKKDGALNTSNHSLYYHTHHGFILGAAAQGGLGSSSSGMASSTASSDRPLILRRKKFKISYFLIILAVFFLTVSLVSIAISFIFPFWVTVSLLNESRNISSIIYNGALVITNQQKSISLIVNNQTSGGGIDLARPIVFDLGIWEVKMHEPLSLLDTSTNKSLPNSYPTPMLWLNMDSSLTIESFLIHLLEFIDLPSTAIIFVVQLLEIIHIVFTLVSLCFTSFTLCLCTSSRSKSSLCWYLVSFLMCLLAFLTGLAVIVLIVVWQSSGLPTLTNQFGDEYFLDRSLSWCFWLAVGINSAVLFSSLLILLYILLRMIILYIRNRTSAKSPSWSSNRYNRNDLRPSKLNSRTARLYQNGISVDDIDISHFSRLPRIPTSQPPPPANPNLISRPPNTNVQERLMAQNQLILAQQHHQQQQSIESMRSPSYIFYTGHGNYHKQEINLNTTSSPGVEASGEFVHPPNHLVNYSFINKNHTNSSPVNGAVATISDHPYSNVVEQPEHRFNNFR